jgi:hypothetical protein
MMERIMRDREAWRHRFDDISVNGLTLPKLLLDLMEQGKWKHPGDPVIQTVIPFLKDPVVFLSSSQHIAFESQGFLADDPQNAFFREYRGAPGIDKPLPWLDVDRALFVAVNRNIGDDVGIALDYRSDVDDPRVVASDWSFNGLHGVCNWREVSSTFTNFVRLLKLGPPDS